MATRAQFLPPEVVVLVLRHVQVKQRLTVCALVSKSWRSAAAAATTSIDTALAGPQATQLLLRYLDQHGFNLESLSLHSAHLQSLTRLPCSRLRSLQLERFKLQLPARNDQPGLLHDATGLTRLCLPCGNYFDGRHDLAALTLLQKLQHLELMHSLPEGAPEGSQDSWSLPSAVVPGTVLAALTALSFLHMPVAETSSMAHISSCTGLQGLKLPQWSRFSTSPAALTGLQHLPQLSYLSLGATNFHISRASTPVLCKLSSLQHLELCDVGLQPSLLLALTQLQHLRLTGCSLLAGDTSGPSELMRALSQLQRLTCLNLDLFHTDIRLPDNATCAALTASSHLQHLRLARACFDSGSELHLFSRPLLQLTALHLDDVIFASWAPSESGTIDVLVAAAPNLQQLSLSPGFCQRLSALQQLDALTSLTLAGMSSDTIVADVASLRGLRSLHMEDCRQTGNRPWDALAVMQLTVLSRLTHLVALGMLPRKGPQSFVSKAPEGAPPDVCRQLLGACLEDDACVQEAAKQLLQLQADLASCRAELRCSQARVAQLERAAAAQEAADGTVAAAAAAVGEAPALAAPATTQAAAAAGAGAVAGHNHPGKHMAGSGDEGGHSHSQAAGWDTASPVERLLAAVRAAAHADARAQGAAGAAAAVAVGVPSVPEAADAGDGQEAAEAGKGGAATAAAAAAHLAAAPAADTDRAGMEGGEAAAAGSETVVAEGQGGRSTAASAQATAVVAAVVAAATPPAAAGAGTGADPAVHSPAARQARQGSSQTASGTGPAAAASAAAGTAAVAPRAGKRKAPGAAASAAGGDGNSASVAGAAEAAVEAESSDELDAGVQTRRTRRKT